MFRKSLLKYDGAKIIDAIKVLDVSANGLVVVVDDGDHLIGVMTDGDIRRGLLRGMEVHDSIDGVVCRDCYTVPIGTSRAQVLDIMKARRIAQVPIIDSERRVVGLHLLNQLILNASLPNAAIIMAGGKGTRLGDMTKTVPKPMLPVAGRPILERIILHLISHGISNIYISVNYLKEVIEDYFGDGKKLGCHIEYLEENQPLGSGGPLSLLPKQNHAVVALYGDLVTDVNLSRMIEYHNQIGAFATMGYSSYKHTIPFGCLETENGELTALSEKPTVVKMINAGVYVISPEALETVPRDKYFMLTDLFVNALEKGQKCGVYPVDGDWIDVGRPADLGRARGV